MVLDCDVGERTIRCSVSLQAELRGELVSLSARLAERDAADAAGAAVAAHQQDTCQVGLVAGVRPALAESLLQSRTFV